MKVLAIPEVYEYLDNLVTILYIANNHTVARYL